MPKKLNKENKKYRKNLRYVHSGMLQRCYNPKSITYNRYGGRGITVSLEWRTFEPFYRWAIKSGYSNDLTLDRINNNGNYGPDNCRWATKREQALNTVRTVMIEFQGRTLCMKDWAEILGISRATVGRRLKSGKSIPEVLTSRYYANRDYRIKKS